MTMNMSTSWTVRAALGALLLGGLGGCVTLPPNSPRSPQDPWESWNRGVYKVNDKLDRAIAKPVARTYVRAVPQVLRTGVHNFFSNLEQPMVMLNDALQGKLKAAGNDLVRFVYNSTMGVGGLLDPATIAGLDKNNEDFGQTLGHWGVHPGPFLELPLLGPSDLRDAPARVVDTYSTPLPYISNLWVGVGLGALGLTDQRAALLPLDETLKNVFDPYAVIRDAYLQRRAYLVADGQVNNADEPLQDPLEDPNDDAGQPQAAPPPAPQAAPQAAPETPPAKAPSTSPGP